MPYKVFYAWQMDHDKKTCRWFIHKAAEEAIQAVVSELQLQDAPAVDTAERTDADEEPEIEIDFATKGEPGTPKIAETILRKISECGVFLADVTIVATTKTADGREKRLPNSNVLIELGAAAASIGWDRIILVMNTAHGRPEHLPFDLQHRSFPLLYELADVNDADKAKKRKQLAKAIAENLQAMKKHAVYTKREREAEESRKIKMREREKEAAEERTDFEFKLLENKFRNFRGKRAVVALTIVPYSPPSKLLDLGQKFLAEHAVRLLPIRATNGDFQPTPHSIVARCHGHAQYERTAITELTNHGVIVAADHWIDKDEEDNMPTVWPFPMYYYETPIIISIRRYLQLLKILSVHGPWWVGLSLLQARKLQLHPRDRISAKFLKPPCEEAHILTDAMIVPDDADLSEGKSVARIFRHQLDQMWRAFGFMRDEYFDEQGNYTVALER